MTDSSTLYPSNLVLGLTPVKRPTCRKKSHDGLRGLKIIIVCKKNHNKDDDFRTASTKRPPNTSRNNVLLTSCIIQNDTFKFYMIHEINVLKAEIRLQSKKTPALHENIGESWYKALKGEFSKPYFLKLSEFVNAERQKATIYPPAEQVYSWTQYCKLEDVKVVILGQDPYHGPKQAHGLCFSVQIGVPAPPSLKNMYKELETDIEGFTIPDHGHLLGWATQGVLLLNACLTVRAANANSHKDKGWEKFTDAIIKAVSENNKDVVFLLWGGYAQKKASHVDKKKHHLLKGPHPSPLSVYRGFYGCKHFSQCNELLKKAGKKTIDWTNLPKTI
ncbi:unnamed protein product, partial [Meganyctiphanes norvegica]